MKLAQSSQIVIEDFFREYFDDKNFLLPNVHFYSGNFSGFLTKTFKIEGITFGNRVFVQPELISLNSRAKIKLPVDLVIHEIIHVLQYKKKGFCLFLIKYLADFLLILKKKEKKDKFSRMEAYLEIPFEIEAREITNIFLKWFKKQQTQVRFVESKIR